MIRLLAVMMVYQLHGIFNVKLAVKVVIIGEYRGIYEQVGVASLKAHLRNMPLRLRDTIKDFGKERR
jgi:hypothetical protein